MILLKRIDPALVPIPATGKVNMFIGLDGVWRGKLENGSVQVYQSGLSPEEVQQIVAAFFQDSSTIDVTHDDLGNILTADVIQSAIDHGNISNLLADHHTQYLNNTRGDARYYTKTQLDGGQLNTLYYTEAEVNSFLNAKINLTAIGAANGVAGLDASQKILIVNIPNGIDHTTLSNRGTNTHAQIDSHIASTSNPHGVTKAQVGLGNCDNTSDANKPISSATQAALNAKYDASNPNGYETPTQLNSRDTANRSRANHTGTQLSNTISDFASTVLSTVLTGISFATNAAILATDTLLVALGKLQSQINSHFGQGGSVHAIATQSVNGFMSAVDKTKLDGLTNDVVLKTTTQLNNTSNSTFATINEHAINVVTGRTYAFEILLRFQTVATATGIGLSIGGSATGQLAANANAIVSTGTAGLFSGPLTAINGVVTTSGVPAANTPYLARITGIFIATTSGLIYPQFRSEVNGSQVSVLAKSITTFKEIV